MFESARTIRRPRATVIVTAILSALLASTFVSVASPADVLGATASKTAICNANLRASTSTSARLRGVVRVGSKVTVVAKISGGAWRTACGGRSVSARTWYRISAVNGKSIKSLYGVTYLYAATSLFKASTFTRYAACATTLRTGASTSYNAKLRIPTGTKVRVTASLTGGRWSKTCAGKALAGTKWYRINAVNGTSVKALYGVSYLYAPAGLFTASRPVPTTTTAPPPSGSRALGVYVHNSAWNYGLLDSYASSVGVMPAMALSYSDWAGNGDGGNRFPRAMLDAFTARGITPVVTWEPWNWNGSGSDPAYKLANIQAGNFDTYINSWVTGARAYGKPIYLRFAHEMNGNWYPWGVGVNGNTPAQFVSVWRKVVTMFRTGGATNVKFVWSPNVVDTDKPLTGLYPGDAYVDMTAMDGYNWGTTRAGAGGWRSFNQIFRSTYDQIQTIAPTKPIIVAETASTEFGGDKAAWIRTAYNDIPSSFPRLAGVIWFDQNKETNWQVSSSSSSLTAYREVTARSAWRGDLP